MSKTYVQSGIIKVSPPKISELRSVRLLICCGIFAMAGFVIWFADPDHMGHNFIFWLLTFALFFKLVKMLHEWYHYWSPGIPVPPSTKRTYTVDMFTTACPGEPREMIIATLEAMVSVRYPQTSYLCDEGNDPLLKKKCEELGVIHVHREKKIDAKAGNINNALKIAKGEICVILDPDHVPEPEFLDRVLPYFGDSSIGFVQCIQAYSNREESFIAKGAAEQTYHFYGPMMMCMNTYGTVQAIGANCTFRRSALDSIGGHAAGLAEDMHTAMQLHAKGWRSVYIPEILTRGLVPATLSSYYQQQLKWSRGTFELLFRTFPKMAGQFTWRQKIHYFTIPMYFLLGLINFLDITIPITALLLADVPWEIDLDQFLIFFAPLCCISLLIRLYAQRWLPEKHEKGFHLAGGMLRTATWWIFLIGFIYSLLKIKVPYIPTPKHDALKNHLKLSLPNLITAAVCIGAVLYGLRIDWTPYTMAMAAYVLLNAGMLIAVAALSQQKAMRWINDRINTIPLFKTATHSAGRGLTVVRQGAYNVLQNGPASLVMGMSVLFISYNTSVGGLPPGVSMEKELGGFYLGIEASASAKELTELESRLGRELVLVAFDCNWNESPDSLAAKLKRIEQSGRMAMINWMPLKDDTGIAAGILRGAHQKYLERCAAVFRGHPAPVFINFAPGFDTGAYHWTDHAGTAEAFRASWHHVYSFFNNLGISNLTWVWNPGSHKSGSFYPGSKFVDWIGMECAGPAAPEASYSFASLYKPFRQQYGSFRKPVLITGFGHAGHAATAWMSDGLIAIRNEFKEVHGLVLSEEYDNSTLRTKGLHQHQDLTTVANQLAKPGLSEIPLLRNDPLYLQLKPVRYESSFVKGKPGDFQLMINGEPLYIQGVAYNTEHDWRDGHMPLTRRRLEQDFDLIRSMGANCIRRYDHGMYDRNILNIAEEKDMKVLYGFWFDPAIDYYRDSSKVKDYMEDVIEKVSAYKDEKAIIGWSLGNETWGLLKHRYAKPYLVKVRQHYIRMIESLARRIHELDPRRPVFSCIEHETYQLPGELVAFHDGVPSIDVIGVNSYYREQIRSLNHLTYQFDSLRPYLISEFGPNGYWDPLYNKFENDAVIEDTEAEKAQWYQEQWEIYVKGYKGYNVGGVAYCWHDRMEGSNTWFGLTDYKGRLKPAYYAMKKAWTTRKEDPLPKFRINVPSTVKAGARSIFTTASFSAHNSGLLYEWQLMKGNFQEEIFSQARYDQKWLVLPLPEEAGEYRLYLYVSDKFGNVTTATLPLKIENKNQ